MRRSLEVKRSRVKPFRWRLKLPLIPSLVGSRYRLQFSIWCGQPYNNGISQGILLACQRIPDVRLTNNVTKENDEHKAGMHIGFACFLQKLEWLWSYVVFLPSDHGMSLKISLRYFVLDGAHSVSPEWGVGVWKWASCRAGRKSLL